MLPIQPRNRWMKWKPPSLNTAMLTEQEQRWIDQTAIQTEIALQHAEAGHDWWHIQRVWINAKEILAKETGVNECVVELATLLHDIADAKFHDGDEEIGPARAIKILQQIGVDKSIIEPVVQIIRHVSFKGGNTNTTYHSPELAIVQDADRLDALGAIGIARAFHYGGFRNREIFNPTIAPLLQMDKETYRKNNGPTINHFYEKLLLLKDRMQTATGKAMAEERHLFMEQFLQQFYAEWFGTNPVPELFTFD